MSEIDLTQLAKPFMPSEIEWRIGQSGKGNKGVWAKVLAYVTNRAIMDRLDDVCGPENWQNEYREWHGAAQLCGISIRVNGEWITKWDGAEATQVESIKGGLSDSMKRAAVQWGIGRYLYGLDEGWADVVEQRKDGYRYAKTKDGVIYWKPPALPAWAVPNQNDSPPPAQAPEKPTRSPAMVLVDNLLRDDKIGGCETVADACAVLTYATSGEYTTPESYRASDADAIEAKRYLDGMVKIAAGKSLVQHVRSQQTSQEI